SMRQGQGASVAHASQTVACEVDIWRIRLPPQPWRARHGESLGGVPGQSAERAAVGGELAETRAPTAGRRPPCPPRSTKKPSTYQSSSWAPRCEVLGARQQRSR